MGGKTSWPQRQLHHLPMECEGECTWYFHAGMAAPPRSAVSLLRLSRSTFGILGLPVVMTLSSCGLHHLLGPPRPKLPPGWGNPSCVRQVQQFSWHW